MYGNRLMKADGTVRDFPWITADELGPARQHIFSVPTDKPGVARQFRNQPANRETEMFFSVEFLGEPLRRHGWITRNATTDRFTNYLIQDCRHNQHIQFIEWGAPHNLIMCVVQDGIYISESHFLMKKEELMKFLDRMEPAVEMPATKRRR